MSDLEQVIEQLWLHNTFAEDSFWLPADRQNLRECQKATTTAMQVLIDCAIATRLTLVLAELVIECSPQSKLRTF